MLPNSIIKMMRDIERMTEGPMVALSRAFEERQRILNGPASEIARSIQEANRIRTENENRAFLIFVYCISVVFEIGLAFSFREQFSRLKQELLQGRNVTDFFLA